jgi:hypothetical protein
MQEIIQRLKDQEITGEKAIEYIDLAMQQTVIVLESDMAERAAYGHAKDETAQAQAHFDQSKAALLELEAKKKLAEEKLEQLRNDQIELTDPVLDDEDVGGSPESLTGGASLFSGTRSQAAAPQAPCDGRPGQLAGPDGAVEGRYVGIKGSRPSTTTALSYSHCRLTPAQPPTQRLAASRTPAIPTSADALRPRFAAPTSADPSSKLVFFFYRSSDKVWRMTHPSTSPP